LRDFRELKVWEKAHQLTLSVYRETQIFSKEKLYKRLFEKYYMKPIISKNLTPLPPFPAREWGF
jgi:hypothetical protein